MIEHWKAEHNSPDCVLRADPEHNLQLRIAPCQRRYGRQPKPLEQTTAGLNAAPSSCNHSVPANTEASS